MTVLFANIPLLAFALVLSVLVLAGGILFAPRVILQLPPDYFTRADHAPLEQWKTRPLLRWTLLALKNLLGGLLLLAGIAMLVLPGQGLLTIGIGLIVLDFPGKYRLKRRIFRAPRVRQWINRFRVRHHREPFR